METLTTVVESGKVQESALETIDVFRWQKYADLEGKIWVVTCTFGLTNTGKKKYVELLDLEQERTIDVTRADFEEWVRSGSMTRLEPRS